MRNLVRDNVHKKHIVISDDFKRDLKWLNSFHQVFNDISVSFNYAPRKLVHLCACPLGLGVVFASPDKV